jgi:glycosyltransferase involved in cell wall biosynthesis
MARIISIVSYTFLPAKMGGHKGIALFHKYFSRWITDTVVTTKANDPTSAEGYEVLNILSDAPSRYINLRYFWTLRRLIRERQATHFMLEHPYYGWLGVLLKRTCNIRLVLHSHNIESIRWKNLGKWWWKILWHYEGWAHRNAHYNFFVTAEDRQFAIDNYKLDPAKCIVMTYGFERETFPAKDVITASRDKIRRQYGLPPDMPILLFNGAFNYGPNLRALEDLLHDINPLLGHDQDKYRLIICGKDIPTTISNKEYPNVIIAGFVDDVDEYLRAADVFLNPIVDGGGIKTKLVEALGNNLTAVSARNGAFGVDPAICNGKLLICENGDWPAFAALIKKALTIHNDIPPAFFANFYWGTSTQKAAQFIQQ